MDSFTFQQDVPVVCVTATSFPEGIKEAFDKLSSALPQNERRIFYGISYPYDGKIIYKAAAGIMGDDNIAGMETFTIRNGPYNSFYIANFMENPDSIKKAFELLLEQHEVDPNGYCLEWYVNEHDVKCMVPLGKEYQEFTGLNREYN